MVGRSGSGSRLGPKHFDKWQGQAMKPEHNGKNEDMETHRVRQKVEGGRY
jgi:hypothetical protein